MNLLVLHLQIRAGRIAFVAEEKQFASVRDHDAGVMGDLHNSLHLDDSECGAGKKLAPCNRSTG